MSEEEASALDRPPDHVQWIHHVMPFVVWMMAMQLLSNVGAWNYAARTALGIAALWYWKPWRFNYAGPALRHLVPGPDPPRNEALRQAVDDRRRDLRVGACKVEVRVHRKVRNRVCGEVVHGKRT